MKTIKITATVLLTMLLVATGVAAQGVAFMKATVLNPSFYGARQHAAYMMVSQTIIRKMTDAVLERAPAVALRTTDTAQAYELAAEAYPPQKIVAMLEKNGPDIARFLISGGDIPVMKGSDEFAAGEVAIVKNLLMPGLWDSLQDKPSFPAIMPFTPEWNLVYGPGLSKSLWLARYYLSMTDQVLWLLLSGIALWVGLLYLLWLKKPKPFFAVTGAVLALNSVLVLALAAAVAYLCPPLAKGSEVWRPISAVANLFGAEYPTLFRTVLWPFRQIFFQTAVLSFTFGVTMSTLGITNEKPVPREPLSAKITIDAPKTKRNTKKLPRPELKMLSLENAGSPCHEAEASLPQPAIEEIKAGQAELPSGKTEADDSPATLAKTAKHKKKP